MFLYVSIQTISMTVSSSLLIMSPAMSNPSSTINTEFFISGTGVFISRSITWVVFLHLLCLCLTLNIWNPVVITVLMLLSAHPNICVSPGLVLMIYLLIMHCIFQLLCMFLFFMGFQTLWIVPCQMLGSPSEMWKEFDPLEHCFKGFLGRSGAEL